MFDMVAPFEYLVVHFVIYIHLQKVRKRNLRVKSGTKCKSFVNVFLFKNLFEGSVHEGKGGEAGRTRFPLSF